MSDLCGKTVSYANDKISWKPFLRQLLICSGIWTSHFMYGLVLGAPTVFIPQIRKKANSTSVIGDDMASWLTSAFSFSGFFCVFIITYLARYAGRKISFMVSCIDAFIAFLVFYCSSSVYQILISEIMQGLFSASQIILSIMVLTEYISPKYRGLFLTVNSATLYWGVWAANALGTFLHWKNIGLVGILCAGYTVVTVFIWPESPYFLASKERYQECSDSHRWLKGCDDDSEKELQVLIHTQKEYFKSCQTTKKDRRDNEIEFCATIKDEDFYKPLLLSILTGILIIFSGKMICTIYAINIIQKITGKESTAYTGMLILDGITVASMYVGCLLSKILKRRVMLLVCSSIGTSFMFILSLYLYLIHLAVIRENNYVSVFLLMIYTLSISCGPLIMSAAIYSELIPLRSRNLATFITALIGRLLVSVTLKLAPYMFKAFDMHGTFLSFGISSAVTILLLYKYLPETKDKTLQEITDSITGKARKKLSSEESSKLVISSNV